MGNSKMLDRFHEVLSYQAREKHEKGKKRPVTAMLDEIQFYYMEQIAEKMQMSKSACITEFVKVAIDEIMDDLKCDDEWFNGFVEMKKAEAEKEAA